MEHFLDTLIKRRSVRSYKKQPVEKEKIDFIVKSALLSPSSRGLCPWEFIIVDDHALIKSLAESKEHGSSFIKDAPLVIVIAADPKRCDVWIEDCSIATIIIQIAAEEVGLSSCWVQIRERFTAGKEKSEDHVKRVLNIPADFNVLSFVGIGYAASEKVPTDIEKLKYGKIHLNRF